MDWKKIKEMAKVLYLKDGNQCPKKGIKILSLALSYRDWVIKPTWHFFNSAEFTSKQVHSQNAKHAYFLKYK